MRNLEKVVTFILVFAILIVGFTLAATQNTTQDTPDSGHNFSTATPNFNFTVTGSNASYKVELMINGSTGYGAVVATNATTFNITSNITLVDGTYNWTFNVTNGSTSNLSATLNFTVDTTLPIVNFTAPTLANGSNSSITAILLNATFTDLHFANITFGLSFVNGTVLNSTLFTDGTRHVNFTSLSDGDYRYNVSGKDGAGNKNTSIVRTVYLDSEFPLIDYSSPALANNSNRSADAIALNATVTEVHFSNITFGMSLANGSLPNTTVFTDSTRFYNFTGLTNGTYVYNISVTDTFNHKNTSVQRTLSLDANLPVVDYTTAALGNNTNRSSNSFKINVSLSENNFANMTFGMSLANGSLSNNTFFAVVTNSFNFSDLGNGTYIYNVTVTDTANNRNTSVQRTVNLDAILPLIDYQGQTQANNTNRSVNTIAVNVSVTEARFSNITFGLSFANGTVLNSTTFTDGTRYVNFTTLANGTYVYNVSVTDTANNRNTSVVRTINLDTTFPTISYVAPTLADGTYAKGDAIYVNVSLDENNAANITYLLSSSSAVVNTTRYNGSVTAVNFTGLADGLYYYNVSVVDESGNINKTVQRSVTLDDVPPSVTFSLSSASVLQSEQITFTCTGSDTLTGITKTLSVKKPNSETFDAVTITLDTGTYSSSTVGIHTARCTGTDGSGNVRMEETTFGVNAAGGSSSSSSSSGGGGGGGSGSSSASTDTEDELEESEETVIEEVPQVETAGDDAQADSEAEAETPEISGLAIFDVPPAASAGIIVAFVALLSGIGLTLWYRKKK